MGSVLRPLPQSLLRQRHHPAPLARSARSRRSPRGNVQPSGVTHGSGGWRHPVSVRRTRLPRKNGVQGSCASSATEAFDETLAGNTGE